MATIDVLDDDGNTVPLEKPNANGRAAAANSRPTAFSTEDLAAINAITTAINSGTVTSGPLTATIVTPADSTFTRPADTTAYAIGDLIANSTTAGSVAALSFAGATKTGSGGSGRIVGWIGQKSGTVAATIRYHFLKTSHAVTNGDNGALVFTSLDIDNYIGYMDVTFGAAENVGASGGSVAKSFDAPLPYKLASGDTIYVIAEALVAFTPANAGTIGGRPIFEVWS